MQFLCLADDIVEKGSREFRLASGKSVFLAAWQGEINAYYNRCPHLGLPLNFLPDRFFNPDQSLLQCSNHMALFTPDDGLCVAGPCHGAKLEKADIKVEGNQIFLIDV